MAETDEIVTALKKHRAAHGNYPESLSRLNPSYVNRPELRYRKIFTLTVEGCEYDAHDNIIHCTHYNKGQFPTTEFSDLDHSEREINRTKSDSLKKAESLVTKILAFKKSSKRYPKNISELNLDIEESNIVYAESFLLYNDVCRYDPTIDKDLAFCYD